MGEVKPYVEPATSARSQQCETRVEDITKNVDSVCVGTGGLSQESKHRREDGLVPCDPAAADSRRWMLRFALLSPLMVGSLGACANAGAPSASQAQMVIDRAALTTESLVGDQSAQARHARQFLQNARAVVICPRVFRAGFFFGGEGGECVLASRASGDSWSDPAFYSMGSGSFGLQIGAQDAQLMIFLMNDTALQAFLNSQFTLGGGAGISLATIGSGIGGATGTAFGADMVSVVKSRGFYGGVSLSGSIFSTDAMLDQQYYAQPVDARQIVVAMGVSNPGANPLRAMLAKYGG